MRRILLISALLILIASPVWALSTAVQAVCAVNSASVAAYCSSCTGADSDVLCDLLAASGTCTWTDVALGTDNTVTWDNSRGGTMGCLDTNDTKDVKITMTTTGASNYAYTYFDSGTGTTERFLQVYVRIISESLNDTNSQIILGLNSQTTGTPASSILLIQSSGQLYFQATWHDGSTTQADTGGTAISAGTWYGIRVHDKPSTADTGITWYVNYDLSGDTWTEEGSGTTGSRAGRYIAIGQAGTTTSRVLSLEAENIKVDDDTMPTHCTN